MLLLIVILLVLCVLHLKQMVKSLEEQKKEAEAKLGTAKKYEEYYKNLKRSYMDLLDRLTAPNHNERKKNKHMPPASREEERDCKFVSPCESIQHIRDHSGEAAEYEEYFRRMLERAKKGTGKEKEEMHLAVIKSVFTESRTCVHLIEAALKFLYLLGWQCLRLVHLQDVLHFPCILETYSAYVLALDSSGTRVLQSTPECLDMVQRILDSDFPFVDGSYQLSLLENLLVEAEVRECVSYFLHYSECMLRVLQVAKKVLGSAHFSMLDLSLRDELFCHVGSPDGLVSAQASLFARESQRKLLDDPISQARIRYESFTPVLGSDREKLKPRLDNFLRDGIILLPVDEQCLIRTLVSEGAQDAARYGLSEDICSRVYSALLKHRPDLEITDIPKKVIRHVLELKPVREMGEPPLCPGEALELSRGYAMDKRLAHLFEPPRRHTECMEM